MMLHGRRTAVRSAFLTRLSDAGLNAIPQDIALEFREHGEHAGKGSPPGGGHVERLRQRYEADTDGM
jgi:hypothetical protein